MTIRLLFVLAMIISTVMQTVVGVRSAPMSGHGTSVRALSAQVPVLDACGAPSEQGIGQTLVSYVTVHDVEVTAEALLCDVDHDDDAALPPMIAIAAVAPFEDLRSPRRSDPDVPPQHRERPPLS